MEDKAIVEHEVDTIRGRLQIVKKPTELEYFPDYGLVLGGREIIPFSPEKLKLIGAYPKKKPLYFVVQVLTGGSGCPAYYKVLDTSQVETILKETFANCSDIIQVKHVENGRLMLTIGGEYWTYENNSLTKVHLTENDLNIIKLRKRIGLD
ncbi:MAG: hypothetical protein OEZ33_08215 [Gammaproteobacteria bacterium]|nr:hypothetical protein [Gammaproteobacteria bacterium]